jgi:hypothetical protein
MAMHVVVKVDWIFLGCYIHDVSLVWVKSLCFIRRNLKVQSQTIKERAYKILIRPKLEYCCTDWDPHTNENINSLETVKVDWIFLGCYIHDVSLVWVK